jgi:hypothetical protein
MNKLVDIEVEINKGPVKEAPKFVHLTFKFNDGDYNTYHHLNLRTEGASTAALASVFIAFAGEMLDKYLSEKEK